MKTDTAHLTWNERWSSSEGRADWLVPEPDVIAAAADLAKKGGTPRVLDLGCCVGRHALHYARQGFETIAVDLASAGLEEVRREAQAQGLEVATQVAPMTELPFPDGHFDHVLSFNVIYHGDQPIVDATIAEIRRVLKPGGTYQGTMLSKRNAGYGVGTEVAPNTFSRVPVPGDADDSDKDHPHFYCNAAELVALFSSFELISLFDREHGKPGSWHWHMLAERLA
jgi:SAM-dependent methyltransferase